MRVAAVIASLSAIVALTPICSSAADAPAAARSSQACVPATIGRREQCLIAGHPCSPRYERQYERHGFKCERNTSGRYRLWQPVKHGQPGV